MLRITIQIYQIKNRLQKIQAVLNLIIYKYYYRFSKCSSISYFSSGSYNKDKKNYSFNKLITNPDFSLGSNQVDFGGIIFPVSAIAIS